MKKGFTLIEVVMSLALFMILSIGVLLLWQHTARSAENAIRIQNALDNLGIAMDALIRNIEFSHTIVLQTDSRNILQRLELEGLGPGPQINPHTYIFTFNSNAQSWQAMYKSLFFGGQQYAYGIETIHIINANNRRLDITITSVCLCRTRCAQIDFCESQISITGSADVLHKHITN